MDESRSGLKRKFDELFEEALGELDRHTQEIQAVISKTPERRRKVTPERRRKVPKDPRARLNQMLNRALDQIDQQEREVDAAISEAIERQAVLLQKRQSCLNLVEQGQVDDGLSNLQPFGSEQTAIIDDSPRKKKRTAQTIQRRSYQEATTSPNTEPAVAEQTETFQKQQSSTPTEEQYLAILGKIAEEMTREADPSPVSRSPEPSVSRLQNIDASPELHPSEPLSEPVPESQPSPIETPPEPSGGQSQDTHSSPDSPSPQPSTGFSQDTDSRLDSGLPGRAANPLTAFEAKSRFPNFPKARGETFLSYRLTPGDRSDLEEVPRCNEYFTRSPITSGQLQFQPVIYMFDIESFLEVFFDEIRHIESCVKYQEANWKPDQAKIVMDASYQVLVNLIDEVLKANYSATLQASPLFDSDIGSPSHVRVYDGKKHEQTVKVQQISLLGDQLLVDGNRATFGGYLQQDVNIIFPVLTFEAMNPHILRQMRDELRQGKHKDSFECWRRCQIRIQELGPRYEKGVLGQLRLWLT